MFEYSSLCIFIPSVLLACQEETPFLFGNLSKTGGTDVRSAARYCVAMLDTPHPNKLSLHVEFF